MNFYKMHGAGNDFIIVDNRENRYNNHNELAKLTCHRHFGIGADGFMAVEKSDTCDIRMRYYNSDGSDATMCGNGIRCFSKYVHDNNMVQKSNFTVETADGIKTIDIKRIDEKKSIVSVDMGPWEYESAHVPVDTAKDEFIEEDIISKDKSFKISGVHMGVPHAVIFVEKIDGNLTCEYGPDIEKKDIFPENINVNFVEVVDEGFIKVDTWERGAGKTLACGTGVCSSAIIANRLKGTSDKVKVEVAGGWLEIEIKDGRVIMTGEAVAICEGKFFI